MSAPPARLPVSAYERAERLLEHNRSRLALRTTVAPHWLDGGERFWYAVETERGTELVIADPARGERRPAFDHGRLAAALTAAGGSEALPYELPLGNLELDGAEARFDAFGARWRCGFDEYRCERLGETDPAALLEVPSPDGRWLAFRRGEDLWVRPAEGGEERRLTADGEARGAYARGPRALDAHHFLRAHGIAELPPALAWSPDSRRIFTHRIDETGVAEMHLLESAPPDGARPRVYAYPYAMPGEPLPSGEWVVVDLEGGIVEADAGPFPFPLLSPVVGGWTWWSDDGATVYCLEQTRDRRTLRLRALDAGSGAVRTLLEESGETRVEPAQDWGAVPMVRLLGGEREALWYSQRDGWGHLYLYDLGSGELIRQVTQGEFAVQQILHVDEGERVAYLEVSGLLAEDPYRRSLARVGLDGGELTRLDDDELDHALIAPPHGRWFIDSASTVATPPVTSVRGRDGELLIELERADVSRLLEAGWTPPERVRALAADGVTAIYGNLYKPFGFDPDQRYPLLDNPYPGPQVKRVPPSFAQPIFGCEAEAMAALGFAVLAIDGRGTPGREKAFHDHSLGDLGGCGIDDHVAAIDQLAGERPWLDRDRVGIFGSSGGALATVRAMLEHPETYKVGVAESGDHDMRCYHADWAETYDGPFDPGAAEHLFVGADVEGLAGSLLLVHGELDDNVPPQLTMRLVDRLIAANKDFDLLIVPGAEHVLVGYRHYVLRRRWDYLVRHLAGIEPPPYRLAEIPLYPLTREDLVAMQLSG